MSRICKLLLLLAVSALVIGLSPQTADADHWRQHHGHWHYYHNGGGWYHYGYHWRTHPPWARHYYYYRYPYYRDYSYRPYWGGYYHGHFGHEHYGLSTPWGSFYFYDDD